MWIVLEDKYYIVVEEKEAGGKKICFSDYDGGSYFDSDFDQDNVMKNLVKCLGNVGGQTNSQKRGHTENDDDDDEEEEGDDDDETPKSKRVKKSEEIEEKEEDESEKEEKGKGDVAKKTELKRKPKKIDLRLKIPPPPARKKLFVDEVEETSERQQEIEEKLWIVYAKAIDKKISQIVDRKCFGCQNDCPSQRDHDLCIETSYSRLLELFLEEAKGQIDMNTIRKSWNDALSNISPPMSFMEMLKFSDIDWFYSHIHSASGDERLIKTLMRFI